MLGQAAGNHDLLALLSQVHQGAHRFSACVLDERAGVDHHHLGIGFIGADPIARLCQQPQHVLGVDTVFFAAQVGKGHGGPGGGCCGSHGSISPTVQRKPWWQLLPGHRCLPMTGRL